MSTTNQATTAAPAAQEPVKGGLRPPVADTDFKEKYPPDRELGHELDNTARVWKVFRDEAIDHDDALLKTWNETVNILLTFAGLFSAAVTSFVVASTDNLKPDPNAYVANLLFALGNATATSAFAHLPAPPPLEAAPTSLARIVTGLWFTSLFLSLAAALLCILVKQWLDEYTARTRGSAKHPRQWAQRRSFYFQGLTDWNVAAIISFLPLFLHLALFLFLAGLTAFLWDLDSDIRWIMLVLMSLLLAFYAVSLFIPVWSAACPYATPLLAQLRNLGYTGLVGVCILRTWPLSCSTMISSLIRRVFHRQSGASLPTSSHAGNARTPDSQIKHLHEQRSRRPFDRVLRKITKTEENLPYEEQGDFTARLDCSSLQWLMHDVSDSDAVAVAWQSLGAFLEEPESLRFTRMRTTLTELVEYAGGDRALWITLRMDGVLDDLQLGRITRSALFVTYSTASGLQRIFYFGVPESDNAYLEDTLSPDLALIYAYSRGSTDHVVQVLHRLHKKNHRPLPSTVMFLLNQYVPDPYYDSPNQAVVGLLLYCNVGALPPSVWTHVASVLCQSYTVTEVIPSYQCGVSCVLNALCACALHLIVDETSGTPNPGRNSAAPFDAYSHVLLVIRILRDVSQSDTGLSSAVWTALTDTRYFSSDIQREDRINANDWANALFELVKSSSSVYASFATQYSSTWTRLLRGFVRDHPTVILDEGIDFDGGATYALGCLAGALTYITPWQIEIVDPALRYARLRSALTLVESASMAICSMDRSQVVIVLGISIDDIVRRIPLVSFFPTDLAVTEEEYNDWVELFVSAAQHLLLLDPLPWNNLRDAVTASPDHGVHDFFNKVHARLVDVGPCRKGDCASKAILDSYWLSALGPTL